MSQANAPKNPREEYELAKTRFPAGHPVRIHAAERRARFDNGAIAWLDLGFEQFSAFRFLHGHLALSEAVRRDRALLPAHWLAFQTPMVTAPVNAEDAQQFRQRWNAGVDGFASLNLDQEVLRQQIGDCVGASTSFYRHYIDDDVSAEQRRYGALVHRMMAAIDPGEPLRPLSENRRRILFCTAYLHQHTVSRLFLPLIEALDRDRFDLHLAHLGDKLETTAERARAAATFHDGGRNLTEWRGAIRDLAPDVIVYLDLGMHPLSQALAALRLAPVQCAMWGHPVTTGLPTIDYFLSPDAIEPADAQSHYSEQLVRLPGFGHGLEANTLPSATPESFGDGIDLICAQSVYKLMPAQDEVFARILSRLPQARLHLIPHQDEDVRRWLIGRMRPTFQAHGVDVDARLVMHDYCPLPEFLALAGRCAVNLDSIGWSGGMSSLDLLQLGLPTVTVAGRTMRTRQTAALLQALGVPELVAADADAYVELAVNLASDEGLRQRIGTRLREGTPSLFNRAPVIKGLSDFLATCGIRESAAT